MPAGGPDRTGAPEPDALHSREAEIRDPAPAAAPLPSSSVPVRTCVGCRSRAPATGLLRVVVVRGVLAPDPRRRLPGRGAWLHPDPDCLGRAQRRGAFPRALRVPGPLDVEELRLHLRLTTQY
ncbi:MAG: YlxR family protein [Pseudonocardia sp.]